MSIAIQDRNKDVIIVSIDGEIGVSIRKELRESVESKLGDGFLDVVINLEKTTLIDSAGLGTLLYISKRSEVAGGRTIIAAPNDHVKNVFKLAKFDMIFDIYPTLPTALSSLEG